MPEDLDALTEIYLEGARAHVALDPAAYREPLRDAVRERLARLVAGQDEDNTYLVAEVDGVLAGSLTVRDEGTPSAGSMLVPVRSAEIGIAVLGAWRGQGVGTALMAAGEAWAAEHGIQRIILDVSAANDGALRLYERLGYRTAGHILRKVVPER